MLVCKYIFDNSIYDNLIPVFNDGYNGYTISDEIDGSYTTRTIECDTLPTEMRFGVATSDAPTNRELSLLEVLEMNTTELTSCNRMFIACQNVTSINTEGWTLEKVTDMSAMFYSCNNLTQLDVSNWDTSKVTNMSSMFYDCDKLTSIDVSKWDTSKVTAMNYMFRGCSNLTELDVSKWDTSQVTSMNSMFHSCRSLTQLDVSNWDTSKVTNMYQMFISCNNLTQLDVSNWDTSQVTTMYQMFRACTFLTFLDLSKWNITKVSSFGYMFSLNSNLKEINLSNWDISNATNINGIFYNCENLEFLNISNWKNANLKEIYRPFGACYKLKTLDISNFEISESTILTDVFNGSNAISYIKCNNQDTINKILSLLPTKTSDSQGTILCKQSDEDLQSIDMNTLSSKNWNVTNETEIIATYVYDTKIYSNLIPVFNEGYVCFVEQDIDDENGIRTRTLEGLGLPTLMRFGNSLSTATEKEKSLLEVLNINSNNLNNVKYMFKHCHNVVNINLTLITNKIDNMQDMFRDCSSLTQLDVSKWDTSNVTSMYAMFHKCHLLTQLDVSNWNTSQVTTMYSMFVRCSNLTQLDVSNWNTSNVNNMNSMFYDCVSLTSLDISNWDMTNVTNMNSMLSLSNKLTDIGMLYCSPSTINTISSALPNDINRTIYYQDVDINDLTPYSHIQYKEYKETNAMINLSSPLLEGDTIEVVDGRLCHYHKMGSVIFDGSENWEISETTSNAYIKLSKYSGIPHKGRGKCFTDTFKYVTTFGPENNYEITLGDAWIVTIHLSNGLLDEFIQYLQQNPATVVYEIAEPYYEDITPLQSQFIIETLEEGNMEILTNLPIKTNISYNTNLYNTTSLEEELNVATMNSTNLTNLLEDEINN